jgi:hypothetical protein
MGGSFPWAINIRVMIFSTAVEPKDSSPPLENADKLTMFFEWGHPVVYRH